MTEENIKNLTKELQNMSYIPSPAKRVYIPKANGKMRGFSPYTKDSYERKAKKVIKYFKKPMEKVTTEELRKYLLKNI